MYTCTKLEILENGVLHNGQQPQSVGMAFVDQSIYLKL